MAGHRVGVCGATGAVGQEMLRVLEERAFPVAELVPLASARSAGRRLPFRSEPHVVREADPDAFAGLDLDLVLLSAGSGPARELAPAAVEAGATVVDNSSAFRGDPEVPLVVPEANGELLDARPRLVANPNCSTIQLVCVLAPVHRAIGVRRVRVATYQAVSGAGARGIDALDEETRAWASEGPALDDDPPGDGPFPRRIAFNLIPWIGRPAGEGRSSEERKMEDETRKILDAPGIEVSAVCVRVPVFRAHSEAVWLETDEPVDPERFRAICAEAPGVRVVDDPEEGGLPTPREVAGTDEVVVGRIRAASGGGIACWIVADQLRKGAALNTVQIAERLLADRGAR